jgi:hypothetical protein
MKRTEAMREFLKIVFERLVLHEFDIRLIDVYEIKSRVTGFSCRYQLMDITYNNNQQIRVVQVEDHTTHETSFLKVPIEEGTSSCIGAIAWTFGLDEETYNPQIET